MRTKQRLLLAGLIPASSSDLWIENMAARRAGG